MELLLDLLGAPLGLLMNLSYRLTNNYGLAILLFTVLTRVILLPVSIWLHQYSIRLVNMTPALLHAQITYFGDNDRIAEEQSRLYKEYKYNPLVTLIPLAVQIILLMGVIQVINHPFDYILHADFEIVSALGLMTSQLLDIPAGDSSLQLSVVGMIQSGAYTQEIAALANSFAPEAFSTVIEGAKGLHTVFCGIDLLLIPSVVGGMTILAPLAAGAAAFVLCIVQNKANALQAEQGVANKAFTMLLSVGLSMYLGYFVPMGVALYWVAGNLVAVIQQYFLNAIIPPRKYIDYAALKENQQQLKSLQDTKKQNKRSRELVRREKADIKRFNSVANKHLVFYSESSGFYKYYKGVIEYLLEHTNLIIHYITGDPNDQIFALEKKEPRLRGYYVGENKLITLMMKMDADVVVMTMPDLETYHIKRSYVRDDIEYIYAAHGIGSNNLLLRKGALDHFDTILCTGISQKTEVEQTEAVYGLPPKKCVEVGYPLIDEMRADYAESAHAAGERRKILIAPSWQKDNIVDSCLEELLNALAKTNCDIIVRPHPQEVRLKKEYMDALKKKYAFVGIEIQTDFTSNNPVMEADLLITDWSDISWEYAFTTLRPVLFINTPMKVMNPEWQKIDYVPLNIQLRDQLGKSLDVDQLSKTAETVEYLLAHTEQYHHRIDALAHEHIYHLGASAEAGAKYIIQTILGKESKKGTRKQ